MRVESRPDVPTDRRSAAAEQLRTRIKESVGITVHAEVIDPDTLERSIGKARRVVDQREL